MKKTLFLISLPIFFAIAQKNQGTIMVTFKNLENKKDLLEGRKTLMIDKLDSRTLGKLQIINEFENSKYDFLKKIIWIEVNDTLLLKSIYNELKADKDIESVRIEPIYEALSCSYPISYNDQKYLQDVDWSYSLDLISAKCAWSITKGNPNILIGIADTDINENHEDLAGKVTTITGTVSGGHNHGTQVAGMAAASTNNNLGIASVGYNLQIAFHRVNHSISYSYWKPNVNPQISCNPNVETCDTSYTAYGSPSLAIRRAFNMGNKIINVSWSGSIDAINATNITNNGTVIVVAAGNRPTDINHSAIAAIPGVINVSGVNSQNMHGPTGNAHNQWVDLCAPSDRLGGLNTTIPGLAGNLNRFNKKYDLLWGTSSAAPQVSAVIGLMLSANPCLTPAQIEDILKRTCDPINDGYLFPGLLGSGRINAYRAVKESVTRYIQNQTIPTSSTTRAFVDIGYDVTNTLAFGAVNLAANSTWTVNAREVTIKNGFEVPLGSELNINTSPNQSLGCP